MKLYEYITFSLSNIMWYPSCKKEKGKPIFLAQYPQRCLKPVVYTLNARAPSLKHLPTVQYSPSQPDRQTRSPIGEQV